MRVRRRGKSATTALTCVVLLLLGACSGSGGTPPDPEALGGLDLPFEVGESDSDRRATISTSIGGATQSLLFDTGSTGISVFANALPDTVASLPGDPFEELFGGGVLLSGVTIEVPVEVAGNTTRGPIMVRVVQTASCSSRAPDCAANDGVEALAESIGADGIFGAGLWSTSPVYSPLTQLEAGTPETIAVTWGGSAGAAILNPVFDADPVATLQMPAGDPSSLPNGTNAWDNRSVPICWQISDSQRSCSATILDTGAAAMSFPIGFPGGPTTDVYELEPGQRIMASASPTADWFLDFTTGNELGKNLVTVIPGQTAVNTGLQFFDQFIVVFSLSDGTVALYAKD